MDAKRTHAIPASSVDELFYSCQPERTKDGKPCQVHVQTSLRKVTLGGMEGQPDFDARWAAALVANDKANVVERQLLLDALPEVTFQDRFAMVVAEPE